MSDRPHWELLPLLYAAVVVGAAFVSLGAGLLLAFVSFPLSVVHAKWPGVRRLRLLFWLGVASNALLAVAAARLMVDIVR